MQAYRRKRILQIAKVEQHRHAGSFRPVDESAGEHRRVDQAVLQRGEAIAAAAGAHQHNAFLVDAPVPERGGNDDLIQSDDGQDADLFAAQLLWRADAWPSDYAVSVFVEISSDNDDIGAGKIRGDMRLRRDNVELYLAAGQRVGRFRATAEKNRL